MTIGEDFRKPSTHRAMLEKVTSDRRLPEMFQCGHVDSFGEKWKEQHHGGAQELFCWNEAHCSTFVDHFLRGTTFLIVVLLPGYVL